MLNNLMANAFNKKLRFIATVILTVAVLGFIVPQPVYAQILDCGTNIGCYFRTALNGFLDLIAGFIAYVSAAFVWLAAFLVNFSFNMNLRLDSGGVIGAGWGITNALANLGFTLAIIVIAFATILRFQSYSYKQTLFKLIAAAMLVNFSLLIAFVFIDFSNVLTGYFLKISTGNKIEIAGSLANAFRVQSMRETASSTTVVSIGEDVVVGLTSIAFQVVFNIIIIITLLALAVMMGIRYIALSILLILAPLAWLFWILPFTQKWWNQWWGAFIKWVIFAPAVSLFVYIAIQTVNTMGATVSGATKDAAKNMTSNQPTFIADVLGKTANMVVLVGILLGGLITANSMGIAGASVAMGVANKIKGAAIGYAGGKLKGGYEAVKNKALTGGQKEETDKITGKKISTSFAQRLARGAAFVPGLRGVAGRVGEASGVRMQAAVQEKIKALEKQTETAGARQIFSNRVLGRIVAPVNPEDAAAEGIQAIKIGLGSQLKTKNKAVWDSYINAIKTTGTSNEVLKIMPELATTFNKTIEDVIKKMRPEETSKINEASLSHIANPTTAGKIVLELQGTNLRSLNRTGSKEQVENTKATIKNLDTNRGTLTATEIGKLDGLLDYIKNNTELQDWA